MGKRADTAEIRNKEPHTRAHQHHVFSFYYFILAMHYFHLSTESVFTLKIVAGHTYPAIKVCSDRAQLEEIWHLEE